MATLTSLPNELIIHILSYLEYFDLKCSISAVNHHLRTMVSTDPDGSPTLDPKLAEILLLEKTRPFTVDNCLSKAEIQRMKAYGVLSIRPRVFRLHPCLNYLRARENSLLVSYEAFSLSTDDIGFHSSSGHFLPISEMTLSKENLTSPASVFITVFARVTYPGANRKTHVMDVTNRLNDETSSITVIRLIEHVMKSLITVWKPPVELPAKMLLPGETILSGMKVYTMLGTDENCNDPTQPHPRII